MRRLVLIAVFSMVGVQVIIAQEKPEPPRREPTLPADTVDTVQKLPQIDLPEFLITGNEAISLPEFTKGALDEERGHDASLRTSGMGKREPPRVELGNIGKAGSSFARHAEGYNGRVIAGYGSYISPFVDAWFGQSYHQSDFLLRAGFRSTDGHVLQADARRGYLSASGGAFLSDGFGGLSGARLKGSVGYHGEGYRFYGSTTPALKRSVGKFMMDIGVNSSIADDITYSVGFSARSAVVKDEVRASETSIGVEGFATSRRDAFELRGDLAITHVFHEAPSATRDPYFGQLGLTARTDIVGDVDINGGVTLYVARGSNTRSIGRAYPRFGATWHATPSASLFARYDPHVQRNTLYDLVAVNAYLSADAPLRHTEYYTSVSAGTEFLLQRLVKAKITGGFKQSRNHVLYVDTAGRGMWEPYYAGVTRVLSLEAEVAAELSRNGNLSISILMQQPKNTETGTVAPYMPFSVFSALYQHRFPINLTIGTTFKVVGRRYADLQHTRKLNSFALLGVSAEYVVLPRLTLILALNNILDQKQVWWENYGGLPFTASAGLGYTW